MDSKRTKNKNYGGDAAAIESGSVLIRAIFGVWPQVARISSD